MTQPGAYQVRIALSAERDMEAVPRDAFRRLTRAILTLETNPRPRNSKRLRGRSEYRVRVGDYRVLYRIDDESRIVVVVAVGHRKDVYR